MEVLRGRRWITNLKIVLSAELQVTFKTCRRVVGALAFVAVGQKKDKSAAFLPLVFRGGDVLVDDDLRAV